MIQSKKIDRYNDDFLLNTDSASKQLVSNTSLQFINENDDWGVSFCFIPSTVQNQRYFLRCRASKGFNIRVQ